MRRIGPRIEGKNRRWRCLCSNGFDKPVLKIAEQNSEPWHAKLQGHLRGVEAVSTAALLDLLRAPATTGTARRLAAVMRSLQFVPIKSRRLMPGGRAGNTVTRGWARPIRRVRSGVAAPQSSQNKG
jgi:hypothetical protein